MEASTIVMAILTTANELELTANSHVEYHVVRVLEKLAANIEKQDSTEQLLNQD